MKALKILSLAALVAGCAFTGSAQGVYSVNIVGFVNQPFYAGENYFADQFIDGDNSLNTIFNPSVVPDGTTFTELNPATHQLLPFSTFDSSTGWSINYTLGLGQGGELDAPSAFSNVFTGSVWPGFSPSSGTFTPPLVTASGLQFLSCYIPIDDATFYDVVGRDPLNGESVTTLNAATQIYTTTTFAGGTWDNGVPNLDVGAAALFDLNSTVTVPEPSTNCLMVVGAAFLLTLTKVRRSARQV